MEKGGNTGMAETCYIVPGRAKLLLTFRTQSKYVLHAKMS